MYWLARHVVPLRLSLSLFVASPPHPSWSSSLLVFIPPRLRPSSSSSLLVLVPPHPSWSSSLLVFIPPRLRPSSSSVNHGSDSLLDERWRLSWRSSSWQDVYGRGHQDLNGAIYLPFGVINIHDQSSAMRQRRATMFYVLWWLLMTTWSLLLPLTQLWTLNDQKY